MAGFEFPRNPAPGEIVSVPGWGTYRWDGVKWVAAGGSGGGGGGGGTITGVIAGTGLTGGGFAGNVSLAADPDTIVMHHWLQTILPPGDIGNAMMTVAAHAGAPTDPNPGDFWWDQDDGRLYLWHQGTTTGQWVGII